MQHCDASFASKKFIIPFLLLAANAAVLRAEEPAPAPPSDFVRTWTASVQAGFTNTFQLVLGGYFGEGAEFQNRASFSLNNAAKRGDSLSVFGWSTTDMPSATPNWQAGITYKAPVFSRGRHSLTLGGGVQRWLLPLVKTGAKDWLISGSLNYSTRIGRVPISVTQDSWSLVSSTLPKGSGLYTQVATQHRLWSRGSFRLALRQGPMHTYSWGFYGAEGNRVFRYGGTVVASWRNTTLEGGCRQQFGLQDGIHYNRYWSLLLTRQFTGRFSRGE